MILKYKTIYEYGYSENEPTEVKADRWNYIDGITDCGVYFDTKAGCTMFHFVENGNDVILALHNEAYLINDAGKTIEKIAY